MQAPPPEILPELFKVLELKKRLKARRVSRKWLESINQQRLYGKCSIIPNQSFHGTIMGLGSLTTTTTISRNEKLLKMFDERSESNLKMVSMNSHFLSAQGLRQLFHSLQNSFQTLKLLHVDLSLKPQEVYVPGPEQRDPFFNKFSAFVNCLNMRDFRFLRYGRKAPRINISNRVEGVGRVLGLKVIWICGIEVPPNLFSGCLFNNLISLAIYETRSSSFWRKALQDTAPTLKHLNIGIK